MIRKTMIVLATAAALTGGLTVEAFAHGGGGFGGGHIGGGRVGGSHSGGGHFGGPGTRGRFAGSHFAGRYGDFGRERGFVVVPGYGYGLYPGYGFYDYGCSYSYPNYYGYSCVVPPG
jgi:hypothetical protein